MIELQVLTPDDWRIWRELRQVALGEAPYAFGSKLADWQGEGDLEERWRGRLSIPGSHNLVVLLDGQPVGMASGVPDDRDGVAELISMWVSPAARGRGAGDRLMAAVEQWARQGGAHTLKLSVTVGNDNAIALYQRSGFTDTGERETMPDGIRSEMIMEKKLELGPGHGRPAHRY